MAEERQRNALLAPLIGEEDATLDDKGRILIGTKLRKRLGPGFTMCLGENCQINAYPEETWNAMVADTLNRDPRLQARQDYARYLMGTAEDELDCDAQGRVVVPKKLRERAHIKDKVKILGCGDSIEIWSMFVYEQYLLDGRSPDPQRQKAMRDCYEKMVNANRFKFGHRPDELENDAQNLN